MREDALNHLTRLTVEIDDRSVGSPGNQKAADYVREVMSGHGWTTEQQKFDALDWEDGAAQLVADDGNSFDVFAGPYSQGCNVHAPLVPIANLAELERAQLSGTHILLHGGITQTPLMPKNFPFYTDEAQQKIIAALERSGAETVLCATDTPPMIEDGDFTVPSVFMSAAEGARLTSFAGQQLHLTSHCRRIPSSAANIVGLMNDRTKKRLVVTAHLDAKKGVPGALDNGTGVTTLLLLAKLLDDYDGPYCIELVALNGEDHYAVPGQVAYLAANPDLADNVVLNINIDGVGYIEGDTAYSFFELSDDLEHIAETELLARPGLCEGIQWPQGDHSMFVQSGCPAIAVSSNWLLENMATQAVTHSQLDQMTLVDPDKLVRNVLALTSFIETVGQFCHQPTVS
ncbi:MAG: M28 family peptidase [Pseudomonadota bacterium]